MPDENVALRFTAEGLDELERRVAQVYAKITGSFQGTGGFNRMTAAEAWESQSQNGRVPVLTAQPLNGGTTTTIGRSGNNMVAPPMVSSTITTPSVAINAQVVNVTGQVVNMLGGAGVATTTATGVLPVGTASSVAAVGTGGRTTAQQAAAQQLLESMFPSQQPQGASFWQRFAQGLGGVYFANRMLQTGANLLDTPANFWSHAGAQSITGGHYISPERAQIMELQYALRMGQSYAGVAESAGQLGLGASAMMYASKMPKAGPLGALSMAVIAGSRLYSSYRQRKFEEDSAQLEFHERGRVAGILTEEAGLGPTTTSVSRRWVGPDWIRDRNFPGLGQYWMQSVGSYTPGVNLASIAPYPGESDRSHQLRLNSIRSQWTGETLPMVASQQPGAARNILNLVQGSYGVHGERADVMSATAQGITSAVGANPLLAIQMLRNAITPQALQQYAVLPALHGDYSQAAALMRPSGSRLTAEQMAGTYLYRALGQVGDIAGLSAGVFGGMAGLVGLSGGSAYAARGYGEQQAAMIGRQEAATATRMRIINQLAPNDLTPGLREEYLQLMQRGTALRGERLGVYRGQFGREFEETHGLIGISRSVMGVGPDAGTDAGLLGTFDAEQSLYGAAVSDPRFRYLSPTQRAQMQFERRFGVARRREATEHELRLAPIAAGRAETEYGVTRGEMLGGTSEIYEAQRRRVGVILAQAEEDERHLGEMKRNRGITVQQYDAELRKLHATRDGELLAARENAERSRVLNLGREAGVAGTYAHLATVRSGSLAALSLTGESLSGLQSQLAAAQANLRRHPDSLHWRSQVAELSAQATQANLAATEYTPSPGLTMESMQLRFGQRALGLVPGLTGDVRALQVGRLRNVGAQMSGLDRQEEWLMARANPADRDAIRMRFMHQRLGLGEEMLGIHHELAVGWEGRVGSLALGMPSTFGRISPAFSLRAAVMRGVDNPHFGLRSFEQAMNYMTATGVASDTYPTNSPMGFLRGAMRGVATTSVKLEPIHVYVHYPNGQVQIQTVAGRQSQLTNSHPRDHAGVVGGTQG